jgi:glutaredoxin
MQSNDEPQRGNRRSFLWIVVAVAAVAFAGSFGRAQLQQARGHRDPVIARDFNAELEQLKSAGPVMLVREGCPACAKAKAWLASRNIEIEARDVEADEVARQVAKTFPESVVPLLITDDAAVLGFSESTWTSALSATLAKSQQ